MPRYRPAPHHELIATKLEAVERGDIKRLMIFMPPRHGKSELASRRFPAWFVGRNPERNIIAASYNSELASDFGRDVRNIVGSPEYKRIFEVGLSQDSSAADRWHTTKGGMYAAAGIGTAVTGRGAHVMLIDDPLKDREEADSETRREKVYRWYTSTAYTRLESELVDDDLDDDDIWRSFKTDIVTGAAKPFEGAIVLIQTRWHEDDLAGRLLEDEKNGGDAWDIVELPALNDAGEALWPQKYGAPRLHAIRKAVGERDWSALYQQRPAPESGDYFKREWFRYYTTLPRHLRMYGASDYAVTAKGGDYTVHLVAGVDPDDNLYITDVWRSQAESHIWVDAFIDLVAKHKPLKWGEEQGQIIKSLGPFIDKRMRERKVYCHREQMASVADKPTRCRSFQARCSMGKVYFPHDAPWAAELQSELLMFPTGKHDDQVDAIGMIGRMLDTMVGGKAPRIDAGNKPDKWKAAFDRRRTEDSNWKTA